VIPNPNAPKAEVPPLPPETPAKLAAAIEAMINDWPAIDDTGVAITHIAEHELLSRLRRERPGDIPVERIGIKELRQALNGHDREGGQSETANADIDPGLMP
jgi:hypothetical protein